MKKSNRLHKLSFAAALSAAMAFTTLPGRAADVTWTNTAFGNWADGTNWSTTPDAPDAGDTIFFNLANGAASFNTGFNYTSFAVDGIRNTTGTGANTVSVFAGPLSVTGTAQANQAATLQLGTGGITVTPGTTSNAAGYLTLGGLNSIGTNVLTIETMGSQEWRSNGNGFNNGRIAIAGNLTGTGTITVSGSGGPVQFDSGTTSAFNGNFVLNSGALRIAGLNQMNRLGPNALTIQSGSVGLATPTLNFANMIFNNTNVDFSQNIVFQDTGTATPVISIDPQSVAGTNTFAFSGTWSGAINDSVNFSPSNSALLVRLQNNASGLTSNKGSGFQNTSAFFLRTGVYSVENANALGAGNSLSLSIGQSGSDSSNFELLNQGLYSNNGINIASPVWVNTNFRSTADQARSATVTLGLRGTGAVSFTGITTLQSENKSSTEGGTATSRVANVKLSAIPGGTTTFSGNIVDSFVTATRNYVPVTVLGGGVVELSGANSTYRGGTSIIGGTTLLANGGSTSSSTGLGNVSVGYAATSFSGTLTAGQSFITGVSSVAGLIVGQTITGTGIAAGTTITYIDPTRNRIEISSNASSGGSTSLATNAETGILGGSGRIRPGEASGVEQRITVASGSSIAPGNSIGTLILDGGATAANLLTMESGATFTFELGSGDSSDQVSFWNYSLGDFTLNNNVINFTGAQEGEYTLFTFFSGTGTGFVDAGITSGLVIGTGLEAFDYELIYNQDNIMLTVVPEPATFIMTGIGLALIILARRRRA